MSVSEIEARARFARSLARKAGVLARRYFLRELEFSAEAKGPQDWVSAADHDVEALIRSELAGAFPTDTMLGEEDGGALGANAWIVDPIDGTINFVHGVRYWCVSLAFLVEGERRIGVIYDPSLDELFWAVRGSGAFCNDSPIHASSCLRVDEALLCAGYVARHSLTQHHELERRLYEAGAAVKDMGAGALMLAHVAAGRFDGYVEPHMHPWDALAGLLLVEEAGGRTYPYPGTTGLAAGGIVVAAAPGIFDQLLRLTLYPPR
ncbi:MAG: inositol monophosphatase [Pseudomonadota bacterium]|nr:inositol monophosphatase [Pseudomonadota bacterium]